MNEEEIEEYVQEVRKRWLERTPATRIDYIEPESRVTRSEMVTWANQKGLIIPIRDDAFDKALFKTV